MSPTDRALFSIHHPISESFTEIPFRPQFMMDGYASFTHNPRANTVAAEQDESFRPQVLVMRSWGAQNNSGEWTYVDDPEESRARGGTANGGILYTPPEHEMEDYLAINSQVDVTASSTTSYVMVTPGVGFALGTPNTDGGLNAKSITIAQDTSSNAVLEISQLKSDRSSAVLIRAELDQTSSEIVVSLGLGSNQAIIIPRGTTAQRQSAISPGGGELRMATNVIAGQDLLEIFDGQTLTWEHHNTASRMASTNNGEGASLVGVEDPGGKITATDVEGALIELADSIVASDQFTELTDTPSSYSTHGLKGVRVNSGASALEFINLDTLYRTQTVLASVNNAEGASLIGIEDSAGIYTATQVEAALAEVKVIANAAMPLAGGTVTGNVVLNDNVELQLGTSSAEGEIFSDGTGMIVGAISGKILHLRGGGSDGLVINTGQEVYAGTSLAVGQAAAADASAVLELESTTTGFLLPRMTSTQRDNIASPVAGLVVYNTTGNTVDYYDGTSWLSLAVV